MTSKATGSNQADAPAISVVTHRFRAHGDHTCAKETSPKSAFSQKQDVGSDLQSAAFPGVDQTGSIGKPPAASGRKKSIQRSASTDAIFYLTRECLNLNNQSVIKSPLTHRVDDSPIHHPNPPSTPSSASPGSMTKSHLNLWPVSSFFKKKLRSSFKKLCQGSTEGLNQELEKLTLTSEDVQRLQNVPDGHRAPVQELLDMFCDSPPMQGSSGTSDTSTPSHLPLLSTLSSSSSSPPPTIASGTGEVQGEPRSHQSYRHHHHYHYQPSWSPRGSPEVPTSFSLGSEVKQVKPLRSFGYSAKGCQETSQSKPRDNKPSTSSYQDVPPSKPSLSSSLLSCSAPPAPLLSPVAVRANIPSNESAFASYPTLPKSFKVKDALYHANRGLEGFGKATAAAGLGSS